MKFHIGCGKRNFGEGWHHVDGADFPHIDSKDVSLTWCENDSAELIYACHFLEYMDRREAEDLLKQWHRVLRPGGIIRLAVPDFDSMVLAINFYHFKLKDILGPLYGRMQMNDRWIYHKTVFNYPDLQEVLLTAGFRDVRRYDWKETEHSQFDDHSQAYLPKGNKLHGILISLNVEAVK